MAYFVSMFAPNRSQWTELKKFNVTEEEIENQIGPFEVARYISGDVFCIPILDQQQKLGILNSIVTSILNQKVWGDCIQLTEQEAFAIGKNRR